MNGTRFMRRWLPALALLGACRSWAPVRGGPASAIGTASAKPVRVTTTDGRVMVLNGAQVVGDSVIGVDTHSRRIALDTAQVKRVETPQTNAAATGLAVIVLLAFIGWFSG